MALSYTVLLMFLLMAAVNIALFCQIRAKEKSLYHFRREQKTLLIILAFFELSYLLRFIWD